MKKLLITSIVGLLFSCEMRPSGEIGKQETMSVCNCEEKLRLEEFLSKSIKDANNMSDEEMEDVIAQLRVTGILTFCHKAPVWVKETEGGYTEVDWKRQKVDSCTFIME